MKKLLFISRESLKNAFDSLMSNKLRSFLTLLGIIIGVMTIIAIISVINGLESSLKDTFANLGTRVLYVERKSWTSNKSKEKKFRAWWRFPRMREKELDAIENCSMAAFVVPGLERNAMVSFQDKSSEGVPIYGTTQDLLNTRPFEIEDGRFFTKYENQESRFVCVLGNNLYNQLFKKTDGIGQTIKIGSMNYKVIGYFKKIGSMMMGFSKSSEDETVYIPIGSMFRQYGRSQPYEHIMVSAYAEEELDILEQEIRTRLRRVRNIPATEPDNFGINRQSQLLDEYNKSTRILWTFIIGIGGLSLLVAGIGVMNIMLISVTERTMEIGLRKAVGAKRRHILAQFLLEALMVCWFGGAIGVFLGVSTTWLISKATPVPFALNINSVYIGFIFTSIVGLFFGIYPAWRAAKRDPVEALRYE